MQPKLGRSLFSQEGPPTQQGQGEADGPRGGSLLGQALATSCLVVSKLKEWRGSAEKKSYEVVEPHPKVGNLKQETAKLHEELQQSRQLQQEAKALLTKKSKDALGLYEEKAKLLPKIERLKEKLAQKY